jgi:hypothetical protein
MGIRFFFIQGTLFVARREQFWAPGRKLSRRHESRFVAWPLLSSTYLGDPDNPTIPSDDVARVLHDFDKG